MKQAISVVMLGATGAVGNHAALYLAMSPSISKLSLLGRREADNVVGGGVVQHTVDIFSVDTYAPLLAGHDVAICTLGVGQPSKVGKEEFIRVDKDAVLQFAIACKAAGILHFELLSSVAVSSDSSSFYLKTKGELEDALKALQFERLSLFHPSMIMTPTNRYGFSQALTLKIMPLIDPLLLGSLKKFRSVQVDKLGMAIAKNVLTPFTSKVEVFEWADFAKLVER